jgi:hypothetical protein
LNKKNYFDKRNLKLSQKISRVESESAEDMFRGLGLDMASRQELLNQNPMFAGEIAEKWDPSG